MYRFLVAHTLAAAQDGVLGMTGERTAGGVELSLLQLALHVLGGPELQATLRGIGTHLVLVLVGVAALALRDVFNVKGAEGVDGHTGALGLAELETNLVENGRQHLFYGGHANAAAPDDGGGELFEVLLGKHNFKALNVDD